MAILKDILVQDVRYSLRHLRRSPSFTLAGTLTLALGIGATAAIFTLFNHMLLRTLPVPEPDRLVVLTSPGPKMGSLSCNQAGPCEAAFSYPMFRDLERLQTVFTGIAAHRSFGVNLAYRGSTLSGSGMLVSGSYFPVLGVQPALGRVFSSIDDRAIGESDVVVLSHRYWQRHFGASATVLNQTLAVNGRRLTIVGVAAPGFDGTTLGRPADVFVPITMRALVETNWKGFDNRRSYWMYLFARLKPGVSPDQARLALDPAYRAIVNDVEVPIQKGMSETTMAQFKAKGLGIEPGGQGQTRLRGQLRTPLTLLLAVTAVVLLIACVNIANLLLARAATRGSEMAVRLSLGARRWHLIAQLLIESLVLATFGGAAGLLVASTLLKMIASILPDGGGSFLPTELDADVLLFVAAVTVGTGLLFGVIPAIHSVRPSLVPTLKGATGQPSGGRNAARVRTVLATTQIALSMALLVVAGLFVTSLRNLGRVDLGMKADHLVTFGLAPHRNGYTPERIRILYEQLEIELAAQPGVTSVTASTVPVISGDDSQADLRVEGFTPGPDDSKSANFNEVGPGYFSTMGIPLMAGRELTQADTVGAPRVALVNEAFAKKFGLGRDAVGKRIGAANKELDTEIVGLVKNAKYNGIQQDVPPMFFLPYRQRERQSSLQFYVRTSLDPELVRATLPRVVAKFDPDLPLQGLKTMEQQVRDSVVGTRFMGVLSTAFAVLATVLAAIGLYGILAYTVAQRTREIGLRMALGAEPGRVRGMILRQVAWMTAIGGACGVAGAIAVGTYAQSMLFELQGHDPLVLSGAAIALALVALIAGVIPAHRAARVDPMRALRQQ